MSPRLIVLICVIGGVLSATLNDAQLDASNLIEDAPLMDQMQPDAWLTFTEEAWKTWRRCAQNMSVSLWKCLKAGSLDMFDRMTSSTVIPLTDGTRLVQHSDIQPTHVVSMKRTASRDDTWAKHVLRGIVKVMTTHMLQFDLEPNGAASESRHRRRNQMLPMMIFGVTALGVFVVPMGFQFLAIVSGKALLMAKMALLLASMNGLKRVASSGIHYGLYHADPAPHHHHAHTTSYWDRQDQPRSLETGPPDDQLSRPHHQLAW